MPGIGQTRLIDYLARATAPSLIREGFTEGRITAVSPLMIQLRGVNKPAPALIVGTAPTSADIGKNALVVEVGGGRRYCLGVIA